MHDPDTPTEPPPPPYPDVSGLTQASAERIRKRQHREDEYAGRNYNELDKYIDDSLVARYSTTKEKQKVRRWKVDLLNLLQRSPYDPTFNFYTSVNAGQIHGKLIEVHRETKGQAATVFASKGEYSAETVFKSLDHLISPQDKRYDEIDCLLKEGNLLNEYPDPIRRRRAEQAVKDIMEYFYQHDWYLRHRDNWGKIWDKLEQLDHGVGELLDDQGQIHKVYEPENFIRSQQLVPDPNPPSKLSQLTSRRRPANLQRSLEHRRVTSRYALISGLRTYGPARLGGVRLSLS